uniref:DUF8039 domain-containing protein n=1 Tax=Tanacetum cinerariifolium TaxID=118510 RepID=A0A699GGM5_TANCI|nr:hypothetical protein [Tanacetum cinerariifolium]
MENQSDVHNHLVEIQADDHDLLVNSDNENNDMLGYESDKYYDDEDADETNHAEDADGTNHSDLKLVNRGITRLYKFRKEYGKPGGIKIKLTFNALNRIENKEIEADEEPPRGIMWLKGRKEADDKIKEGTLNLDDGTNAMTVVFGKEKGGYARGVRSGVTYKRYFRLPRSRQATNERIELLQTQLHNERCERQQKDVSVKKFSIEMKGKRWVQLNMSSQVHVASNVTPMGTYEVDGTQSSVVVRVKDARIQKKSNGLVTSKKEPVKTVRPKKTPVTKKQASKCKLWHLKKSNIVALGTVYEFDGKQMLHNQELPNDCYKVLIDSSLVDAACIPDIGNNGLKTVKDGVGGFFAWPKNHVVLDEEVTPPTTIQKISDYNSAPKLKSKRKNYVSRETMQRQARKGKSYKYLNYGS